MNAKSMKESEDLKSPRDFRTISGRVLEVRERVSESGFKEKMCVESEGFCTREFNAIHGLCRVLRTAQSFFKSMLEDVEFS